MQPTVTKISYTYKKQESSVFVLNADDIPVPKDHVHDLQVIQFGPGSIGGNHAHQRIEWFIAFGELWFYWLDESGKMHKRAMFTLEGLLLFEVPRLLPHAIKNHAKNAIGFVYELSDAKMTDVTKIKVIE